MSFLQSIGSIFSGGNTSNSPPQNPNNTQQPFNQATQNDGRADPNQFRGQTPVVNLGGTQQPANPQNPNQQQTDPNTPASPMADYAELFKVDPTKAAEENKPLFNLDPTKFQETVNKMNFASAITSDDVSKITAGGDEAVKVLANLLNSTGREAFSKAAQFSTKLAESGYNNTRESLLKDLPAHIRKSSASNDLFESNPALRDPAAQPLIEAMQNNFAAKFPNASTQEVNSMVQDYFSKLPQLFGQPEVKKISKEEARYDFSSFMN